MRCPRRDQRCSRTSIRCHARLNAIIKYPDCASISELRIMAFKVPKTAVSAAFLAQGDDVPDKSQNHAWRDEYNGERPHSSLGYQIAKPVRV